MRFKIGNRHSSLAKPTEDIPHYYRYHLENPGADVLIAAWQCPVNAPTGADAEWFGRNCTLPLDTVNFVFEDPVEGAGTTDSIASTAHLPGTRDLNIIATPAAGYAHEPYMMCEISAPDDAADNTIRCNWYTWQLAPGDITVYAWECPEGYDFTARHADPMADCIGIASGVEIRLRASNPDHERLAQSGAFRMGAARFGDLEPGEYTLSEMTSSDGSTESTLWQCFGVSGERSQPAPGTGPEITFSITSGEHIMCHRFHVRHGAGNPAR